MPYRRLPNTDLARLHALQNAIQRAQIADYTEQVLPYKVQSEAQRFLVPRVVRKHRHAIERQLHLYR